MMYRTFAIFLLAGLMATTTNAKPRSERDDQSQLRHRFDPVAFMTEQLDLNEQQQEELAIIFEDAKAAHEELRDAYQDESCDIRADVREQLETVLDEDQLELLEDLKTEHETRRGHFGSPLNDCE